MYYYGARYYDPRISIFISVDPLVEQTMEPYSYVGNNPIMFTDPTGMSADPIYDTNGNLIGDDGKADGKAYVVKGGVKRNVIKATDKRECYTGDLELGKNGASIPIGNKNDQVQENFNESQESLRENGGHSEYGDSEMSRWREGPEKKTTINKDGGVNSVVSIEPFRKPRGQVGLYTPNENDTEFIWHIHPADNDVPKAGSANASPKDKTFNSNYNKDSFKTTIFIIGGRTNSVKFYNGKKSYMNISYGVFKRIGNGQ